MIEPPEAEVRRLIAAGATAELDEVLAVCPYRTLFGANGVPLNPSSPWGATVAVLGFTPDDMHPDMVADVVADVRRGITVLLISNSRLLRDHAKHEIVLALTPAAGRS